MYVSVTHDIQVTAIPDFLMERSDPAQDHYFWAYTIEIANLGRRRVQLIYRHWIIIDAFGRKEEVRGPGVVGEQPVLGARRDIPLCVPCARSPRPRA